MTRSMREQEPGRKLWIESPLAEKYWPSDWIITKAVYEISLVSGADISLREIADRKLDELKELGFDLYVMGIWEIERDHDAGIKGRGTPFCIRNHRHVDPEWGTDADLDYLLAQAAEKGVAIGFDAVLNHVSRRNPLARRPGFCLTDKNGNLQTAACTSIINGGEEEVFFEDVVQLNHANPVVREELKEIVLSIVRRAPKNCKLFFRVDLAAQMLNAALERRWGIQMPEREWLADIIEAVHAINPNVAFIAEAHGEATAEQLRRIGFNVVPSKADEHNGGNTGYYDAHVSQDPRHINRSIRSFVRMQDNDSVSAMATVGGHDEPALKRAMGDWYKGAMALTLFLRPNLWLGHTEDGYDYGGNRRALDPFETNKMIPLDAHHNFRVMDPDLLATWQRLCRTANHVMKELGDQVSFHELVGNETSQWVGYAIRSKVNPNAPVYIIVGNPTYNNEVVFHNFGHIPPKTVWLINTKTGDKNRLV